MAVDFPSSPTVGQTFTSGGATWIWDGVKWTATGAATGLYLPLTGGTLTGDLILARDPVVPLGAATKQQIDAITAQGAFSHDNRIINGDMRIDQRNNGANGTANGYTIDRWWFFNTTAPTGRGTWGRAVAGPPLVALGFGYGLSFTSSSAYTPLAADNCGFFQMIEADMVSDFAWGTPGAQPVTLSFWVQSTLTGTFSGAIRNVPATRAYLFTFNIPSANTWTKIVVTVPGDTAGTWVMSGNAAGVQLIFDLGSGANFRGPANAWAATNYTGATGSVSVVATNGASFSFTGVKLEIGSIATPYNRQSMARRLADCQRYYQTSAVSRGCYGPVIGISDVNRFPFPVQMRAAPTLTPTWSTQTIATGTVGAVSAAIYSFAVTTNAVGNYVAVGTFTADAEL